MRMTPSTYKTLVKLSTLLLTFHWDPGGWLPSGTDQTKHMYLNYWIYKFYSYFLKVKQVKNTMTSLIGCMLYPVPNQTNRMTGTFFLTGEQCEKQKLWWWGLKNRWRRRKPPLHLIIFFSQWVRSSYLFTNDKVIGEEDQYRRISKAASERLVNVYQHLLRINRFIIQ